jgi:predicted DNA-binding transcriptional regulator YafY
MVRDAEPLGVSFNQSAWYLVAWCRLRNDFRSFKLERVQSLEMLDERFAARPDFSLREYLERSMANEVTFRARVWFSTEAMERVRRDVFMGVASERPVAGGSDVEFQTFSFEWLARWLLLFGRDAEALDPPDLRKLVHDEAMAVAKKYA